jgi:hypothetical protein
MSQGEQVQARLEQAVRAVREKRALEQRLAAAQQHLESTRARAVELRAALEREDEDVERLESFSPTRIWATLTGSRAGDLEREAAEREAARYAVAEAEARRESAERDCAALQERLRAIGDVEPAYQQALADKDAWVRGHDADTARELADIAERRGALLAEDTEAREAHAAGVAAHAQLQEADRLLGDAGSWSTWDAFGGGMLSDVMKYQKLDRCLAPSTCSSTTSSPTWRCAPVSRRRAAGCGKRWEPWSVPSSRWRTADAASGRSSPSWTPAGNGSSWPDRAMAG